MFVNKKFVVVVLHKYVDRAHILHRLLIDRFLLQIALPKERLNDLPIHTFTPLTLSKSIGNSDRSYSLDTQ